VAEIYAFFLVLYKSNIHHTGFVGEKCFVYLIMITREQIKGFLRISKLSAGGISKPVLEEKYLRQFEKWLNRGYHADMEWLKRTKDDRIDIRKKFSWAKSVLVVLDNYFNHPFLSHSGIKIARYAMGQDYHDVVEKKLRIVLAEIRKIDKNTEGKIFVDSGPLIEKAYAEQAGLGWIGKNGVFIGEGIGSYSFIGILLLSIDVQPSDKTANRCDSCTLCVERCPNRAIVEPGLIDAGRCIAYLTIEKKGEFSNLERNYLNKWVYGCDACQEVCPWNHKWSKLTPDPRYYDRKEQIRSYIDLGNQGNMDKFNMVFKKTAIERLTYKRMQRNMNAALQ